MFAEMSDADQRHDRRMCMLVGHAMAARARLKAARQTKQHSLNYKLDVCMNKLINE